MLVTDILGYDVNAPSLLKLVHADLENQFNEKPEVKSMVEKLANTITELIAYECLENELDLEYDEITILELIKALGVKIETQSDTIFEKMFEIYKRTKKKFLGSFWWPEKLEEFIIYKKNSGFYIFYFGVILASIIMTSKDVKFGSGEGNFGLIVLAAIIVFFLESLWLRISFLPIFSKYIPKIVKIFITLVFLFSLYSFMLPNIAFIFELRFYILIPLIFVILFFIYKKLIVRYTENGLLAMNEIESFRKYILNFEKLEVPTFSSEDELIENFQQMYIYAFALGIEKRFLNFLDVTLEKNNFAGRKEVIYEKLWISTVFCDKKLLGELKLNVMGR